jgi:hypothetical protein
MAQDGGQGFRLDPCNGAEQSGGAGCAVAINYQANGTTYRFQSALM